MSRFARREATSVTTRSGSAGTTGSPARTRRNTAEPLPTRSRSTTRCALRGMLLKQRRSNSRWRRLRHEAVAARRSEGHDEEARRRLWRKGKGARQAAACAEGTEAEQQADCRRLGAGGIVGRRSPTPTVPSRDFPRFRRATAWRDVRSEVTVLKRKGDDQSSFGSLAELVPQSYVIPLADFRAANPASSSRTAFFPCGGFSTERAPER